MAYMTLLDDRELHSVDRPRLTKSAGRERDLLEWPIHLAMMAALTFCMGCTALRNPGAPDQSFDENKDIQALEERYGEASAITKYYDAAQQPTCSNSPLAKCKTASDCPSEPGSTIACKAGETKAARNEFIAGRLTLINLQYIKFIRGFAVSKSQLESAFDVLITGVGLATAAAGGETVKAALGAASAGLGATRTSIDKNFFYEKAVPVLITAMNAQRKVALLPILRGIQEPNIDRYSLAQALSDLSEYYFAGTFVGALQAIQRDAGAKEATADESIEIARSPDAAKALGTPEVRKKTGQIQTKIDALSDDDALALAKNPPVTAAVIDQALLAQFPTNAWQTNPAAARSALKFRVTMMIDPLKDLLKWEKALP